MKDKQIAMALVGLAFLAFITVAVLFTSQAMV